MKKIFGFALLLLVVMPLTSCTQVKQLGCALQVYLVHQAAPATATALQCANEAAIENDLMNAVNVTGFCSQAANPNALPAEKGKKPLGVSPAICEIAADAIVGLASKAVPTTWQCQLTNAGATLAATISAACMALPF